MRSMKLTVNTKRSSSILGNTEKYEGTVTLPGLKPTKLAKADGCTEYGTRSALTQAAQALARNLNCVLKADQTPRKAVAAKKSTKSCHNIAPKTSRWLD